LFRSPAVLLDRADLLERKGNGRQSGWPKHGWRRVLFHRRESASHAATGAARRSPSFDSAAAHSDVEVLIRSDDALATLNARLTERFGAVLARHEAGRQVPGKPLKLCAPVSRMPICAPRENCWPNGFCKNLNIVVRFACGGNPANEVTAYLCDTERPSVRLAYGDGINTGTHSRTASGGLYDASLGRYAWSKGEQAAFV
jgi:hypothetical protein